jgi:uncharacterized protein (DUF3084 family)
METDLKQARDNLQDVKKEKETVQFRLRETKSNSDKTVKDMYKTIEKLLSNQCNQKEFTYSLKNILSK